MSKKIVVLISGSGSNLQALIDASTGEDRTLEGDIVQVISSSPKAYGLQRAAKAGIPSLVHALKPYYEGIGKDETARRKEARDRFDADLAGLIIKESPDLVVCAGWMLILSSACLTPLEKEHIPIINLHPALPGCFEGTHAIERSWDAGQRGLVSEGGCMVHYVIEQVDLGEPLVVKKLPVVKGESVDEWEAKIHALEHLAIVEGAQVVLRKTPAQASKDVPPSADTAVSDLTSSLSRLATE